MITSEAREDGKSIKLKDLIADPVWGEAVEASPLVEHFLSAMCVHTSRVLAQNLFHFAIVAAFGLPPDIHT